MAAAGAAQRVWWLSARMFMLTPGALVLASIPEGIDWWVRMLIFAVTVVGGSLATSVEAKAPRLVPPVQGPQLERRGGASCGHQRQRPRQPEHTTDQGTSHQ